jgi:hypothetical protein
VTVERETGPIEEGRDAGAAAAIGPIDAGPEGPTEGAEDPVPEGADTVAELHAANDDR